MMKKLQITGGSTRGKDHLIAGRNNQDAFVIRQTPDVTVAVVCDGCGSGAHSEVGAKLGAEILVDIISERLYAYGPVVSYKDTLEDANWFVVNTINEMAQYFGERKNEFLSQHFLFTCVGVIFSKEDAVFFSLGDGYIAINGEITKFGPFVNNAPPYLAYKLLPTSLAKEDLEFKIHKIIPLDELENFMLGTDGVDELIDEENAPLPNKKGVVGPLSQFWTDDKFFKNKFNLGRTLSIINGGVPKVIVTDDDEELNAITTQVVMGNGLLRDDTTMVVGRMVEEKEND